VWGFGGDSQWRENPVDGIASRKRRLRGHVWTCMDRQACLPSFAFQALTDKGSGHVGGRSTPLLARQLTMCRSTTAAGSWHGGGSEVLVQLDD
jgi:hypothetical protein